MGNEFSLKNKKDYSKIMENYRIKGKKIDQRFDEVTMLENKINQQEEVILKQIVTHSYKEFLRIFSRFENYKKIKHPNILEILQLNNSAEKQLCSNFFVINSLIEFSSNTLELEIKNKNGYKF